LKGIVPSFLPVELIIVFLSADNADKLFDDQLLRNRKFSRKQFKNTFDEAMKQYKRHTIDAIKAMMPPSDVVQLDIHSPYLNDNCGELETDCILKINITKGSAPPWICDASLSHNDRPLFLARNWKVQSVPRVVSLNTTDQESSSTSPTTSESKYSLTEDITAAILKATKDTLSKREEFPLSSSSSSLTYSNSTVHQENTTPNGTSENDS
jgi:hypothetical protein